MFWNNVKIALRNLRKNKVFALVNILGLALGLTIYVFGGLIVKYERTQNAARIYTIGSTAAPDLNVGIDKFNATFTTIGPIIAAELQDVDAVARSVNRGFLLASGSESFYEDVSFADTRMSHSRTPRCSKYSTSITSTAIQLHWRIHLAWYSQSRPQSSILVAPMSLARPLHSTMNSTFASQL
jgi:hypothetical protein